MLRPFRLRTDMINEKEPLVNTFISVPKDMGNLNCAAFVAGVVHGILDSGWSRPETSQLARIELDLSCLISVSF
jgi:hypothetical protein